MSFLLAVLCLDAFWVKLPEELHNGDIPPTLKRQSVVNLLVALGATGAVRAPGTKKPGLRTGLLQLDAIQTSRRPTCGERGGK